MEQKTALLVMDVQPGIIERINNQEEFLNNTKKTIKLAHDRNIQVIYVVVGFRDGFPEVSQDNKSFAGIKENSTKVMINPKPVIETEGNDLVVVKHRVSAFSGSDLEMVLRAQDIRHLVLCGISTSGVVLSTVREAADKDFNLTVFSDLCADFDEEVHNILLEKVFPRQANVIKSSNWN